MKKYISLFTGVGGLDLGLEAAGWEPAICVEIDSEARAVARANNPNWLFADTPDIHAYARDPETLVNYAGCRKDQIDLIAGGPPCQPFSKAGTWHSGEVSGLRDPRAKTLRSMMAIVAHVLPRFVLIENVPGLKGGTESPALPYLRGAFGRINRKNGTNYVLSHFNLNAADYGVPQLRKRLFLIACRQGTQFVAPPATHSSDGRKRYVNCWTAIGKTKVSRTEAPLLALRGKWADLLPSIPEGENYLWHTDRGGGKPLFGWRTRYWSFLLKLAKERPSWTILAQPGPATGPFHWENRLLSIRELARLQTFPNSIQFPVSYRSARLQIGNAVPPLLGEVMGRLLRKELGDVLPGKRIWIPNRNLGQSPGPSDTSDVPTKFMHESGRHAPHPGLQRHARRTQERVAASIQRNSPVFRLLWE